MLKNMLEAASEMMKESKEPKVQCAKTIIDKIVVGLGGSISEIEPTVDELLQTAPAKKAKKANQADPKYKVIVEHGKLIQIEGLPEDAKIEVDGVITTHAEAKGKPFQNGRII